MKAKDRKIIEETVTKKYELEEQIMYLADIRRTLEDCM